MASSTSSSTSSSSVVVGLMLCKPNPKTCSDPNMSQSVPLVLWSCRQSSAAEAEVGSSSDWTFYSYSENPPRAASNPSQNDSEGDTDAISEPLFAHTSALLQRLGPIQTVHVTCEPGLLGGSSSGSKGKKSGSSSHNSSVAVIWKRLVQWLETTLKKQQPQQQSPSDASSTDSAAAAAPITAVQVHDSAGLTADSLARLSSRLQDLASTHTASLRVAADLELSESASIRKALVFLLRCQGLWDTGSMEIDGSGNSRITLQAGVVPSCLYLDRTAAAAIHLWPPEGGLGGATHVGGHKHSNSVFGLLSEPVQTTAGRRLLEAWLRQPLVDLTRIQQRQDAVAALVQQSVARDAIRQEGLRLFKGSAGDLFKLANTLADYAVADDEENEDDNNDNNTPAGSTRKALQSLYELYTVSSQKLPLLLEQVMEAADDLGTNNNNENNIDNNNQSLLQTAVVTPLQQGHAELQRSVDLCTAVLDLDAAPREFLVRAEYKEELHDLQQELAAVQTELQACHDAMNDAWAQVSGQSHAVRLETVNTNNNNSSSTADNTSQQEWQFRLPDTNDSKALQQQLGSKVTIHRLLKNGVYFSTKPLRQLASQHHDLLHDYQHHQRQVALDAVRVAATYRTVLEKVGDAVALLDVLTALAHVAAYSPHGYCRPVLTDHNDTTVGNNKNDSNNNNNPIMGMELQGARHPCVELQESMEYIPNDVRLQYGESSFLLVTGPNMGGKSTYIRALGAIVTMAQIGSFVPCTSATINLCHHVLARVGAGDLQEKGISTFMAEMLESSSILRTATNRSLIIIDELGRGTSTFDGYGLARAISEYICQQIGCMTVFATHFHELTALEEQQAAAQNCHITAKATSTAGLTFLYQVKPGPCLESFGIQVAEMANVPLAVIQDAKRKAKELENFEYRPAKKTRAPDNNNGQDEDSPSSPGADNDNDIDDDHAQAEKSAAALAWMNRFRRLPETVFTDQYRSDEEKRAAFRQLLLEA